MREILFKAKRVDNGKWVEGYYVCLGGKFHYIAVGKLDITEGYPLPQLVHIKLETLCQYTGLTDKNDKKIYDNDIVEIPKEDDYFRIEWQEDTASFVMSNDSFIVTFDNYWSYEVEVIGNIFDNTELIK